MSETSSVRPLIAKYLADAKVILNIGCGTEEKITPEAIGIDIRHGLADIVLDNPEDIYRLDQCGRLLKQMERIRPGGADVIFSSHTLEHLGEWARFIKSLYFLLKPGGLVILYLPDARYYDNFKNPEYLQSWTANEFKNEIIRYRLIDNCFEILEIKEDVGSARYSFYAVLKRRG